MISWRGEKKLSLSNKLFKRSEAHGDGVYGLKTFHDPGLGNAIVHVVFIHGLTGHREHTWATRKDVKGWPETLLPRKIPQARILSFGYDASVIGWRSRISSNRVGDHAQNLLSALATHRVGEGSERPIIFVAHSLGGLVCQDALLSSRASAEDHLQRILKFTWGILFLGTPHSGTGLASLAGRLSQLLSPTAWTNHWIAEVLRRDSEVLSRIQNDFRSLLRSVEDEAHRRIEITCFYEELPVPGIGQIVPRNSAIVPGYTAIGIHSDHREMARFKSENDLGFISVVGELQRWMKDIVSPYSKVKSGKPGEIIGSSQYGSVESIEPGGMVDSPVGAKLGQKERYGAITILGDVVKSNISSSQTVHGNLIFT